MAKIKDRGLSEEYLMGEGFEVLKRPVGMGNYLYRVDKVAEKSVRMVVLKKEGDGLYHHLTSKNFKEK